MQICIEVLYDCPWHANLTILVTVTIYYAAKHDVHVCGQRDLALLKMVMCQQKMLAIQCWYENGVREDLGSKQ